MLMRNAYARSARKGQRRGFQVLELLFVVPVVALLLTAAIAYGGALIVYPSVVHAAAAGAREAGKGAGFGDVLEAVNASLAVHDAAIATAAGSGTKIVVEDSTGVREYGDPCVVVPARAPLSPDEVRVLVCLRSGARKIDGKRPVFPCFGVLGRCLTGDLWAESLVKKDSLQAGAVCQSLGVQTGSCP